MNDFLCFWNKSQVLSIYSVLGDKLYDKRKPIPQWMIYKSLCLNYLLCWISTIINNFRQKSGLLQMRLLVSCREYRIFLLFPDLLFDFSIARLTIWGIRSIRHHSNPASGNTRCHRLRLHAVPRMWHFLRSVFCPSRAYAFSEGDARACFFRRHFG